MVSSRMLPSPPDSTGEHLVDLQQGDFPKFDMEAYSQQEPIPLQPRFAELKRKIVSANPDAIAASWTRLLRELKREIDLISSMNAAEIVPSIDFEGVTESSADALRADFAFKLRKRGIGIIRGVVSRKTALAWRQSLYDYISTNPQTRTSTCNTLPKEHSVFKLFWSPAQVKARAHPSVLTAQRFAMSLWSTPSTRPAGSASGSSPLIATTSPVAYADRLVVPVPAPWGPQLQSTAQVDNGSVERWEPDGYGRARTYSYIFEGWWEGHDPWDASARVLATPDLYAGGGRCSVFRMLQGWLSLGRPDDELDVNTGSINGVRDGEAGLAVLPLLKHATAYCLLRPFFSPGMALYDETLSATEKWDAFLSETNWNLIPPDKQDSILHGALPSYAQEINSLLHPHLRLDESLVSIPALEPGDYLVWHPDLIHTAVPGDGSIMVCLPACPLTQHNVLYLAQQRKAFMLGTSGPDFASGGSRTSTGESQHVGRPGVQDVSDGGGEDGLSAMGLYPWDEDGAKTERDREVRRMANGILFPDRFGVL